MSRYDTRSQPKQARQPQFWQGERQRSVGMAKLVKNFAQDESGATSIEYGVIALIMGVGIIATISAFPTSLNAIWSNVAGYFN